MAKTTSNMLPLNTKAPEFRLKDTVSAKVFELQSFKQPVLVVAFICNHCPYVVHIKQRMAELFNRWIKEGIDVVAISANDPIQYPEDSPEKMREMAIAHTWNFPYLFDETQNVAKSYDAACTPDFYVFNQDRLLIYRGQFDSSRPSNQIEVSGQDLENAVRCAQNSQTPAKKQIPSIGCNIKWR